MTASAGSDAFGAIPGMDFLKNLMPGAGTASPAAAGIAWMLPTVDLDELDKRIKDLKTVQFWLEQNSRVLASTIQTLEVQRMTVATLKGMNVSMQEAMGQWTAAAQSAADSVAASASVEEPAEPSPRTLAEESSSAAPESTEAPAAEAGSAAQAILPQALQWWDQLSRQFAQIAAAAVETAGAAADNAAQSVQTAAAPAAGGASTASPDSARRRRSPRTAAAPTAATSPACNSPPPKAASQSVPSRPRTRPRNSSQS